MKKIIRCLVPFLFSFALSNAQVNFDNRLTRDIEWLSIASNGDYFLSGRSSLGINPYGRLNPNGSVQWIRDYTLSNYFGSGKAVETNSGHWLIPFIWPDSAQSIDVPAFLRIDAQGNVVSGFYIPDTVLNVQTLTHTSDGYNVLFYSEAGPYPNSNGVKFEDNGNVIWSAEYSGIAPTHSIPGDNGSVICCEFNIVYRISQGGAIEWVMQFYENNYYVFITDIKHHPSGGYLLGGRSTYGGSHGVLIRVNSTGQVIWSQSYVYPDTIQTEDALVAPGTDAYYIAMQRYGSDDDLVIKTDTSGIPLWSVQTNAAGFQPLEILQTGDGGFVLLAHSHDMASHYIQVLKSDSAGSALACFLPYPAGSQPAAVTSSPSVLYAFGDFQPFNMMSIVSAPSPVSMIPGCLFSGLPKAEDAQIVLYPNPVEHELTVSVPASESAGVSLFGIDGACIIGETEMEMNTKARLNVSSIAAGLYILKVTTPGGSLYRKILKTHGRN